MTSKMVCDQTDPTNIATNVIIINLMLLFVIVYREQERLGQSKEHGMIFSRDMIVHSMFTLFNFPHIPCMWTIRNLHVVYTCNLNLDNLLGAKIILLLISNYTFMHKCE